MSVDLSEIIEEIDDDDELVGAELDPEDLDLAVELMNAGVSGVGDIDIVGDDGAGAELEIVGARPKRSGSRRLAITKTQLRGIVAKNVANALRRRKPVAVQRTDTITDTETAYLPIYRDATNGGLVTAGQEAVIKVEPQKPFRPEALVLDDDTARDFLILDLRIGNDPLFVTEGAIPGSQFTADAVLNKLQLRTGKTSQQFSMRVRNRTPDDKPFYASFKGTTTMR